MRGEHRRVEPSILYFGTPVVLISTRNENGSANIAPMSSAFWLGWRCVLGLDGTSKTTENLIRTGECVLNLPSEQNVGCADRLAYLTGSYPVPAGKLARGYRHEANKFEAAGLTQVPAETVSAPRAMECPIQMEAVLAAKHGLGEDSEWKGDLAIFEVRITESSRDTGRHDGRFLEPHRSRQVAALDHEFSKILWSFRRSGFQFAPRQNR